MNEDDRHSVKVETKWDIGTGEIFQDISGTGSLHGAVSRFARSIVQTQDEGIRKALIALRWTPPDDESENDALMARLRRTLNFHPDSEFDNLADLFNQGFKAWPKESHGTLKQCLFDEIWDHERAKAIISG